MISKKITAILLCLTLTFGGSAVAFADSKDNTSITKTLNKHAFNYSVEDYLDVLPFKVSNKDVKTIKILFNDITNAFEKNDLTKADKLLKEFYKVMGKYWLSEDTFDTLLPFESMMKFGGKLLNDAQKEELQKEFDKIKVFAKEKNLEAYFAQIKKVHTLYYKSIGNAVGDMNGEYQLIAYIKGADKLTASDLVNYTFEDYLQILPFTIKDNDYTKGKALFLQIVQNLKKDNEKEAKKITLELNNLLAPYWISDEALDLVVPHEKYQKEIVKFLSRKDQLSLNSAYNKIVEAKKAKDYDEYFEAINEYFDILALSIQNFYGDYFDEIIFIRS